MRQTLALLIDAYRDLNSRKLFWITLAISGAIIIALAMIGVDQDAITFFRMRLEMHGYFDPSAMYRELIISVFVIGIWLTWGAIALALISTAGVFPDLISSGSIDLYLSKPISRLRLFVTKYLTGLLFVALQVTLFMLGCFVVVGIRIHEWRPSLFLAIPLIVAMFSYLFAFSTLIGVWTRSAVAAILLTALVWLLCGLVQRFEPWLLLNRLALEQANARVERINRISPSQYSLHQASNLKSTERWFQIIHQLFAAAQSILPKTTETTNLLDRYLMSKRELNPSISNQSDDTSGPPTFFGASQRDQAVAMSELQKQLLARTPLSIIGSSLLCELVVLLFAGWLFCRRDY